MRAYVPNQRQQLKLNNDIQSMKLFICDHLYLRWIYFKKVTICRLITYIVTLNVTLNFFLIKIGVVFTKICLPLI